MLTQLFNSLLPLLALIALAWLGLRLLSRPRSSAPAPAPAPKREKSFEASAYQLRSHLFTPAEIAFLNVVDEVIGDKFRVFGKVRWHDIFEVARQHGGNRNWALTGKTRDRHIDFVICDKRELSIECLIELDDKSHQRQNQRARDRLLHTLCAEHDLTLVRVRVQQRYDRAAIAKQLAPYSKNVVR